MTVVHTVGLSHYKYKKKTFLKAYTLKLLFLTLLLLKEINFYLIFGKKGRSFLQLQ